MIVNPHAPSGRLEPAQRLRDIAGELRGRCVLLIDEAYVNFAREDALPLLADEAKLDNVLLLRTLSKGYSLAGLRFGYALGHAGLIAALDKARDSYNTDVLSQRAATAALQQREQAASSWRKVIQERERLSAELGKRGWFVYPSESNFVLARPPALRRRGAGGMGGEPVATPHPGARSMYETLKQQSIFVRYFDQPRLRDKLRITIGTPQETAALLGALDAL